MILVAFTLVILVWGFSMKKAIIISTFVLGIGPVIVGCGEDNLAEDSAEKTSEQEAKSLMNAGKYQEAIDILEPLYEDEPTEYARLPLLAAAYAGKAGIEILSLLDAQIEAASSGTSGSIFDQVKAFLPDDYTRTELNIMDQSVETLLVIPESLRGETGDPDYGPSAEFQLTLYQTVYSSMYVNLFVSVDPSGNLDPSKLEDLTADDVSNILGALEGAAASQGAQSEEVSAAVSEALEEIEQQEGADDREKLINYINEQEQEQQQS